MASSNIREEEVKNRLRDQFFQDYDATPILGDIDFAVALRQDEEQDLFDREYLLWAEAKAGMKEDILASFVQLIITIGKARTHEKLLPPRFLGAFDEEPRRPFFRVKLLLASRGKISQKKIEKNLVDWKIYTMFAVEKLEGEALQREEQTNTEANFHKFFLKEADAQHQAS